MLNRLFPPIQTKNIGGHVSDYCVEKEITTGGTTVAEEDYAP